MKKMKVVVKRGNSGINNSSSDAGAGAGAGTGAGVVRNNNIRYGECQKNHAANSGGYAVDGCREFLASTGSEGTSGALTCAACGCHRNFHKREVHSATNN